MSSGGKETIQRLMIFGGCTIIGPFIGFTVRPLWLTFPLAVMCGYGWSVLSIYILKPWINEAKER